jgi:ATP-dependent RNA helicase DHX57
VSDKYPSKRIYLFRLDRRFWIHDRQLLVRGVENSGLEASVVHESPFANSEHVSKFSLAKLTSFGFHTSRCAKALHEAKGDVGAALENLLTECFASEKEAATAERLTESEITFFNEQKEDEKLALESIYGEAFTERIAGKVWEIKLELGALEQYTKDEEKATKSRSKGSSDEDGACQFFARGYCKFGKRCHKRHVQVYITCALL